MSTLVVFLVDNYSNLKMENQEKKSRVEKRGKVKVDFEIKGI